MRWTAVPVPGRRVVPTWGRAFRGAAAIVLFAILWVILGIFLFLVGIAMIGFSMLANPLGSSAGVGLFQASGIVGFGLGLVLVIAGIALSLLRFLASFLKDVRDDRRGDRPTRGAGPTRVVAASHRARGVPWHR